MKSPENIVGTPKRTEYVQNTYLIRIGGLENLYPYYDPYSPEHDPHFCVQKHVQNTYSRQFLAMIKISRFKHFWLVFGKS